MIMEVYLQDMIRTLLIIQAVPLGLLGILVNFAKSLLLKI